MGKRPPTPHPNTTQSPCPRRRKITVRPHGAPPTPRPWGTPLALPRRRATHIPSLWPKDAFSRTLSPCPQRRKITPPRTRGRVPPRRTRRCRPKPCPWPPLTLQRAEGNHHAAPVGKQASDRARGRAQPPLSRGRRSQSPKPSTHRSCRASRGAPFMLRLCTRPSRFDGRGHRVDHTYRHATPRTAPWARPQTADARARPSFRALGRNPSSHTKPWANTAHRQWAALPPTTPGRRQSPTPDSARPLRPPPAAGGTPANRSPRDRPAPAP